MDKLTPEQREAKNQTIRQLWLDFRNIPTEHITDLEAEIWALITMHPAIQDRLDTANTEPEDECPLCKEAILYTPNQIALRKIEEWADVHKPISREEWGVLLCITDWLQQEDK